MAQRIVDVGPCGQAIDEATLQRAADVIRAGGIVAFPTDTLYGVACDAWNAAGLKALYELKGRSESKPVAIVVAAAEDVGTVAICEADSPVAKVVGELLPGPFTVVLPRGGALLADLNPGVETVGVRVVPAQAPSATAICRALGPRSALALTSANLSGGTSPLRVEDFAELHANIDLVLDGGEIPAASRAGSTIVNLCRSQEFSIIREGLTGGASHVASVAEAAGLVPTPV